MTISSAAVLDYGAATNLIANGGVETNITGWASGADRVMERSLEQAHSGVASIKTTASITFGSGANIAEYPNLVLTAEDHMYSLWLYIPSSWTGGNIAVSFNAFAGGVGSTTTNADLGLRDQWQRVVVGPFAPVAGDLAGSVIVRATVAFNSGEFAYIDDAQVEPGTIATPYIHTDGAVASRAAMAIALPVRSLNGARGELV